MQFLSHILVFSALFVLCLTDREILNWSHSSSKCGAGEKASTLLDFSKDFINKAKDMYPNCVEDGQECGQKEKSLALLDVAMNLISEVKKGYPTCPDTECPKQVELAQDCSDILHSGKNQNGLYTIWPKSRDVVTNKSLTVYCDMETDGGGWTVIQRRGKFSTPKDYFYKDWESYKNGFGDLTEEFWIGNDNIYAITNKALVSKPYKVRFDLTDRAGKVGYAEYDSFWIEDEAAGYTLHIDGYKGNVGDSMKVHNKQKFSTKDRKNENWPKGSCAVFKQGAWWYNSCSVVNLNGLYQPGVEDDKGITWFSWGNRNFGLSATEIKLRM